MDVYFDFWDGLAFWEERQSEAWSAFEFLGIGDLGGYLCCGASGGGLVRDLEFYWLCGAFDDSFGPDLSQISSCRRNCCEYGSFFLFRDVQSGVLGLASHPLAVLPDGLYQSRVLTPFGFPFPGFRSSDYFPILPWFFLFSAGYFFFPILQKSQKLQNVFSVRIPVLSKLGTWSLWIYLIHQPVAMGICMLLFH